MCLIKRHGRACWAVVAIPGPAAVAAAVDDPVCVAVGVPEAQDVPVLEDMSRVIAVALAVAVPVEAVAVAVVVVLAVALAVAVAVLLLCCGCAVAVALHVALALAVALAVDVIALNKL